jgi:transcriptional regulator with XRE-family HTH domain
MQRHPHRLIDTLLKVYNLKNDRDLANKLVSSTGTISRIRSGSQPVSATFLLNAHDRSGLALATLRELVNEENNRRQHLTQNHGS